MIRKPAEGWGRESAAVATARNVAAGGKAAVLTGGRLLRGLGLCALGGLWIFAGLSAGLFGNLPTLVGVGGLGLLAIAGGLHIMRGPRTAGDTARARPDAEPGFGPAATGQAATIAYSRGKLLAHAGFGVFAILFAVWGVGHFGGAWRVVMTLLIPVFAIMALAAMRRALGDLTALRWDRRGLTVRTLFSHRDLAWSDVVDIGIQQVSTYALFGLMRVGSQRSLMLRLASGGLFGKRMGVSSNLLDLGGRTLESLVLELSAAQAGRNPASPSTASAAPIWASQPAPAFDPVAQTAAPMRSTAPAPARTADQPPRFGTGPARAFGRRGV